MFVAFAFLPWKAVREEGSITKQRAALRHRICQQLDLEMSAATAMKNSFVYFVEYPVCGVLFWQQRWAKIEGIQVDYALSEMLETRSVLKFFSSFLKICIVECFGFRIFRLVTLSLYLLLHTKDIIKQ